MAKYVIVPRPDSKQLMGKPGFWENAHLINDVRGIQVFGSSAYFVNEEWLAKAEGTKTDSKNNATYVIVPWPDSKELMSKPCFWENAYLINDAKGIQVFGGSAYFVNEEWLAKAEGMKTDSKIIPNNNKTHLADAANRAFQALKEAREEALDQLANIVSVAGGFVATLPRSDKPILNAVVDYGGSLEYVNVYGLRYEKGKGLFLCTEDQVDNYSIKKGYYINSLQDFDGEDLEHLNKMLSDLAYFVNIQDEKIVLSTTLISILGGLAAYL